MFLWASSQPTATHAPIELLATRALPTKKLIKDQSVGPTLGCQLM